MLEAQQTTRQPDRPNQSKELSWNDQAFSGEEAERKWNAIEGELREEQVRSSPSRVAARCAGLRLTGVLGNFRRRWQERGRRKQALWESCWTTLSKPMVRPSSGIREGRLAQGLSVQRSRGGRPHLLTVSSGSWILWF